MYIIKEIKIVNNLLTITIFGNGEKLKNGTILEDNFKNRFLIKNVAMTGNFKETILFVICQVKVNDRIGKLLERVGDLNNEKEHGN